MESIKYLFKVCTIFFLFRRLVVPLARPPISCRASIHPASGQRIGFLKHEHNVLAFGCESEEKKGREQECTGLWFVRLAESSRKMKTDPKHLQRYAGRQNQISPLKILVPYFYNNLICLRFISQQPANGIRARRGCGQAALK